MPRSASSSSPRRTALAGACAGLLFGLLIVLFGFGAALFIVLCGVVGGVLGGLAHRALGDRLEDVWNVLRQGRGSSSGGSEAAR